VRFQNSKIVKSHRFAHEAFETITCLANSVAKSPNGVTSSPAAIEAVGPQAQAVRAEWSAVPSFGQFHFEFKCPAERTVSCSGISQFKYQSLSIVEARKYPSLASVGSCPGDQPVNRQIVTKTSDGLPIPSFGKRSKDQWDIHSGREMFVTEL
jgi:hypothetical protein